MPAACCHFSRGHACFAVVTVVVAEVYIVLRASKRSEQPETDQARRRDSDAVSAKSGGNNDGRFSRRGRSSSVSTYVGIDMRGVDEKDSETTEMQVSDCVVPSLSVLMLTVLRGLSFALLPFLSRHVACCLANSGLCSGSVRACFVRAEFVRFLAYRAIRC